MSSTVEHNGAFQGKDTARAFPPARRGVTPVVAAVAAPPEATCRSRDGPGSESFFLLGFKGERAPGASALGRRRDGDARDCPRSPSEASRDDAGASRRPDGSHGPVPGRLRLRHFSRVPVTRFLLIPVRSLTRIPRFDPTVPPIPHRRPPRADRGPAGAPNLPHEALVPRRHPREVQVLVRKTNIFLRDERDARRTTRGEASEREVRLMSTKGADVYRGVYVGLSARVGRARRSYPRAHLPTPRSRRESVVSEACFKGFDVFARRARGRALRARLLSRRPNAEKSRPKATRTSERSPLLTDAFPNPPANPIAPSAGTSCLA